MAARRIAVAYSGGRDSTALLHATLAEAPEHGVEVVALHVHHGLSPYADAWLAHCEAQCRRWARAGKPVRFAALRLSGRPAPGESIEAWARQGRYTALRDLALASDAPVVLLAHHRRDQAETLLLQALRGAGVAGLSAMPRVAQRDGLCWQRPWLDRPRAEIETYLRRHRLRYIEDDSNADPRFDRNRLRLQVWPALTAAFEHAETSLAAAAGWAQQARALLDEIAATDLAQLAVGEGLQLTAWRELSPARRANVLRAWVRLRSGVAAPASLIVRLLDELPGRRSASWPLGPWTLRLHRGTLHCVATQTPPRVPATGHASSDEDLRRRDEATPARGRTATGVDADDGPGANTRAEDEVATALTLEPEAGLSVLGHGRFALPGWGGVLHVARVAANGIPLAWLAQLELRQRAGGERFQAGLGRPPRSLKKQYQQAGIPDWERGGPLIYSGGQLLFVPGLGVDARVIGLPGQDLVTLQWRGR